VPNSAALRTSSPLVAVIFSHGFGVRRDSRGMFTELAGRLEKDNLIVLFDYVDIDQDGNTTAYPFSKQVEMLKDVIEYIREQQTLKEISIVAHSQGCVIVGLVSPKDINKILLVAGPTSAPGQRMKEYFSQREGTEIHEEGVSKIVRSDGTLTFIPPEYWQEASETNPAAAYLRLPKESKVYFIRARQDQVVIREDYSSIKSSQNIGYIELDGNHDFERGDRRGWLDEMVNILKQE